MAAIVLPLHDPNGILMKFIKEVIPTLKENFDRAFISITPTNQKLNPESVEWLQKDSFFKLNFNEETSKIGDHFLTAFKSAIENSDEDQSLHLCTGDRLAWAILNDKNTFLKNLKEAENKTETTVFLRSKKAWSTHPQNYFAAESMLTKAGEILLGKTLDFGWCHVVVKSNKLKQVLPQIKSHDLVVFAELIYLLKDELRNIEVDWLAWEDPFIFGKNEEIFKNEREKDPAELEKRMGYVLPMMKFIFEKYQENE